jgi:hypothetical protein
LAIDENIFSADLITDVNVETLVGDGKKYKSIDDLAKAYSHLDNFAEELKRDNAQLRAKEDAKNLLPDGSKEQQNDQPKTPANPAETPKPQLNDKDLRSLVSEVVKDAAQSQRFENNVEETARKMVEVYGSTAKAQEMILQKSKELGVTPDWLRDAAARSPSAFYATMGINPSATQTNRETPNSRGEVRLDPVNKTGQKSYSYFQELRRTNKADYYSAGTQAEMQRLARELGDAFYGA